MILKDLLKKYSAQEFAEACSDCLEVAEIIREKTITNFLRTYNYVNNLSPVISHDKVLIGHFAEGHSAVDVYLKEEIKAFFDSEEDEDFDADLVFPSGDHDENLTWGEMLGIEVDMPSIEAVGVLPAIAYIFTSITEYGYTESEIQKRQAEKRKLHDNLFSNPTMESLNEWWETAKGVHDRGNNEESILEEDPDFAQDVLDAIKTFNLLKKQSEKEPVICDVAIDCTALASLINANNAECCEEDIDGEYVFNALVEAENEKEDIIDDSDSLAVMFEQLAARREDLEEEMTVLRDYYERELKK